MLSKETQSQIFDRETLKAMKLSWDAEEREQITRYYFPVAPDTNSSHWHDYDCCQSHRCFTARPGSVEFDPDGLHVNIRMPDGRQEVIARDDPRWLEREGAGLYDSRFDICFEKDNNDRWQFRCGYKGQALY